MYQVEYGPGFAGGRLTMPPAKARPTGRCCAQGFQAGGAGFPIWW